MNKIILIFLMIISTINTYSQVFAIDGKQLSFNVINPTPEPTQQVGAIINGYYEITTPTYTPSAQIVLNSTNDNTIVENKSFTDLDVIAIQLWECSNITIRNCKFKGIKASSISTENVNGLLIENCVFDSCYDGVQLTAGTTNPYNNYTNSNVKINHNYFKNIIGGWPYHHAIQFAGIHGTEGNQINYNTFEMIPGQSFVDDIVSCFGSYGSPTDSIQVIGNWFRGGNWNAENHTGSGITFGDNGGGYIHVKNNIIINITSGAIGEASGNNCVVEYNTIYQSQELANPSNWADGYIMYNFDAVPSEENCYNNTWQYNRGLWLTNDGTDATYRALSYENNSCTEAIGTATNVVDWDLNTTWSTILPTRIDNLYHW